MSGGAIAGWSITGWAIAGWAIDGLLASTLLMAAVLVVRRPVRQLFGPALAYALWALPLLRLALPPLPAAWRASAATPISRASEAIILVVDAAAPAKPTPAAVSGGLSSPPSLAAVLLLIWAAGAIGLLGFHLIGHARFCRRVLAGTRRVEQIGEVAVLTSDAAPGPLAFGVWRRYVAFPRDFAERYDEVEQALALAHELGHHQGRDLLANWAGLAVLAVHWFNPLAWQAYRAFRADQELANDARVLAGRGSALRQAYGRTIVKAAHGGAVSAACHLHTIADLKGRLRMLARSPASRRRLASGSTAVAALVVAGLALTASGSGAAALTSSVKETIGVPQDMPTASPMAEAPPLPPVPPVRPHNGHQRVVLVENGGALDDGADVQPAPAAPAMPARPWPPAPPAPDRFEFHLQDDGAVARTGHKMIVVLREPDRPVITLPVDVPQVLSRRCEGGAGRPVVEHGGKGDAQRIIICTNRIEAMAREAQQLAANSVDIERQARITARASLTTARAAIERDRNLTDEQRREALTGLAKAEAELAGDVN